jgi:hypothetical protein
VGSAETVPRQTGSSAFRHERALLPRLILKWDHLPLHRPIAKACPNLVLRGRPRDRPLISFSDQAPDGGQVSLGIDVAGLDLQSLFEIKNSLGKLPLLGERDSHVGMDIGGLGA